PCSAVVWTLSFRWVGVAQTWTAHADTGNGCCPPMGASKWTRTAGTHTLTALECKGSCVKCCHSYSFTINGTGDVAVDGNTYTATNTTGCTYTGTSIDLA